MSFITTPTGLQFIGKLFKEMSSRFFVDKNILPDLSASSDYVNSDLSSPSIYCARKGSEDDIRDSAYQFNLELSQLPIITVDLEVRTITKNAFVFRNESVIFLGRGCQPCGFVRHEVPT